MSAEPEYRVFLGAETFDPKDVATRARRRASAARRRAEAAGPRAGEPEATLVHFNVPLTEPDLWP